MLLPEKGAAKNFRLYHAWLYAAGVFVLVMGGFGVWGISSARSVSELTQLLHQTQLELAGLQEAKRTEVAALESDLAVEKEKMSIYAKNIGQLEARLTRLDSLGKQLVEVSSLNESEFDFDVAPAMGGPLVPTNQESAQSANLSEEWAIDGRVKGISGELVDLDLQLMALGRLLENGRESEVARPQGWPTSGGWLSSHFGVRSDPFTGKPARHLGVDIANKWKAPVLAASRGVVSFVGKVDGFGYLVEVDHGFGYQTRYAHLSKANVAVGDTVEQSQKVGEVGSSGRSTGAHLHFEVLHYGVQVNPENYLPKA